MGMRNGEPVAGLEFYDLLTEDNEFCAELGRSVLAAGRLETALLNYLDQVQTTPTLRRATLGQLIEFAMSHDLLGDMIGALEMVRDQRNYLTHNLHALFSAAIEETILPRANLLDSDVDVFTDRARQLAENLAGLAEILEQCRVPWSSDALGARATRVRD